MNITFNFEIGDIVKLPIGGIGRVLGQRSFGQGSEYNVRYFNNGDEKSVWFFEDEIELKERKNDKP